jgi:hypothetical protein
MSRVAPVLLVLALLPGCLATAPRMRSEKLGTPAEGFELSDVPVLGYQVRVVPQMGPDVTGELLGVDGEHVFVLDGRGVRIIHLTDLRQVYVDVMNSSNGVVGAVATGVGTVSTISHGILLVLSAPAWAVLGTAAAVAASAAQRAEFSRASINLLRDYARFPQGVPPAFAECPVHLRKPPEPGPADVPPGMPLVPVPTAPEAQPPPPV